MKRSVFSITFILAFTTVALAQNSNSSASKSRPRTTNTNAAQTPKPDAGKTPTNQASGKRTVTQAPGSEAVLAAFNKILEGIRQANVRQVTGAYWNSAQLILFNNNGSVTKGWEQMRENRESSYPEAKDVKLDVHDVHVLMLGRDGAVVTCLWNQSQTFKGTPESASGRMTLVFKRVGAEWKAVHLHTSPDAPNASRVLPSERTPSPTPKPVAKP